MEARRIALADLNAGSRRPAQPARVSISGASPGGFTRLGNRFIHPAAQDDDRAEAPPPRRGFDVRDPAPFYDLDGAADAAGDESHHAENAQGQP